MDSIGVSEALDSGSIPDEATIISHTFCSMTTSQHIAKHLREVFYGGNWTWSNVKDNLQEVTCERALNKPENMNSIAMLTYHIGYYVTAILKVMEGSPINAKDEFSFDVPTIQSQAEWEAMVTKILTEAESLAKLIEQLPDEKLNDTFVAEKYGTYYRNLHGLIEHTHYHLGQIAIIKKLV